MPTAAVRGRRLRIFDFFLHLLYAGGLDDGTPVPAPMGLAAFLPAVFLFDTPCSAGRTADADVADVAGSRVAGPLRTGVGVSIPTPSPAFFPFFLELTPAVPMETVLAGICSTAPGVEATRLSVLAPGIKYFVY